MFELIAAQIITESLPISSSGHLALIERLFERWSGTIVTVPQPLIWASHLPSVVIMLVAFRDRWWTLMRAPWRCRFIIMNFVTYGIIAELATLAPYLVLSHAMVQALPLTVGFCITAAALYSDRYRPRGNYQPISWRCALLMGCAQGSAAVPGVSRLAVTYTMGRVQGLAPRQALFWSSLLALPPFVAASLYGLWLERGTLASYVTAINFWFWGIVVVLVAYGAFVAVYRAMVRGTIWRLSWYMVVPIMISLLF